MIVFIGGVVAGATGAFFSDTESSYGNTFTAGAVDLTIDSVQHYNGMVCVLIGENYQWVPNTAVSLDENNHPFVLDQNYSAVVWNEANPLAYPKAGTACDGTWPLKNLTSNEVTSDRFFNFDDVKPGDFGENTISIHVHSNDAWMCASLSNVGGDDPLETKTEPELATGDIDTISELPENLYFFAWADDGDNIFEPNNEVDFALGEVTSASELSDGTWALADSTTGNGPIAANGTQYIGVAWCLGEMTVDENTGVITCDGSVVGNEVQTDSFYADISFYVEQARNNAGFECEDVSWPDAEVVGALFSAYVPPSIESCDVVIDDGDTNFAIQTALDNPDYTVICVDPSYNGNVPGGDQYPLNINRDGITLAGLGNAGDAVLQMGVFLNASDVTITGFTFAGYSLIQASERAALYIHNEAGEGSGIPLSNTVIAYNKFISSGSAKASNAKAIITEIGSGGGPVADGLHIHNNLFYNWQQAMFFNTARNYIVEYNDIYFNTVGVANDGPHNARINNNDFEDNTEGVGVAPSATNGTPHNGILAVTVNNFESGNTVNWYGPSIAVGADVDATQNWWDGMIPAVRTNDVTEVDTGGELFLPYAEN